MTSAHDLKLSLESEQVERGVADNLLPFSIVAKRHGKFCVQLCQDTVINFGDLLADSFKIDFEIHGRYFVVIISNELKPNVLRYSIVDFEVGKSNKNIKDSQIYVAKFIMFKNPFE